MYFCLFVLNFSLIMDECEEVRFINVELFVLVIVIVLFGYFLSKIIVMKNFKIICLCYCKFYIDYIFVVSFDFLFCVCLLNSEFVVLIFIGDSIDLNKVNIKLLC